MRNINYLIIGLAIISLTLIMMGCNQNNSIPQDQPSDDYDYSESCIPDHIQCYTCQPMHDNCFDDSTIKKSCDLCCSEKFYEDYLGHKPCDCPKDAECLCAGAFYCGEKE
jgi:hypothetical protein